MDYNRVIREVEAVNKTVEKGVGHEFDSIKKDLEVLESLIEYEQVKRKVMDLYMNMEDLYASGDRTVDVSVVSRKLMDVLYIFM